MKRVLAILMAVAMMASLISGCGKSVDLDKIDAQKYVTTLFEYKGMELSAHKQEITDEYVDSYIEFMLAQYPVSVPVTDRAVQVGDTANIDYVGKDMNGVAFEGGTAQGYDLIIGSGMFVPGFEDGLVGANIGETRDVELTFPENYHSEDLAGQDVVFTVTINSITGSEPAELNDEFVAQFGSASVEEFRNTVIVALEEDALVTYEEELQRQIIDKLLAECVFADELPNNLVESYKEQIHSNFEMVAANYGMDVETYVKSSDMTMEEFEENVLVGAIDSTKEVLVCKVIADKENISVTDEELEQNIQDNYANFGYLSADDYKENENVEEYRDYLLTAKVLSFIISNANITALSPEEAPAETVTEAE
ncbi:MAG: trigger factor [Lachnospiraceae bacterium]|nr:trigger factor [Lachnospiraceae bacterium]